MCQAAAPAPPLLDSDSEGIEDALVGVGREAGGGGSQGHPSPSPPSLSLVDREPQSRGPEAGIQTKYVAIRAALKIVCFFGVLQVSDFCVTTVGVFLRIKGKERGSWMSVVVIAHCCLLHTNLVTSHQS